MRSLPQLAKEYPETDSGLPLRLVRPGLYADNGDVIRGFLQGVTGLALLVLVAACANLASLLRRARPIAAGNWRSGWPSERAGGGWCGN